MLLPEIAGAQHGRRSMAHPVILGGKLALLLVILMVLIVLYGVLTPEQFRVALFVAAGVFVVGVVGLWVLVLRSMRNPKSWLGRLLVLSDSERAGDGYTSASSRFREMIGRRGVALSKLRPSGTAQFGRERVSVVTEAEFIEQGTEVEIVSVEGARVVVRRPEPPDGDQNDA
jgi:membrane-bound serine protease (ClpP class)